MRVFVITDDTALLRVTEFSLRVEGIEVTAFVSALDALAKLSEDSHPDAIVLDLNMPVMDGREFYRSARQIGYENPVLILSAYNAGPVSQELGADDWLAKPFLPSELARKVNRLCK